MLNTVYISNEKDIFYSGEEISKLISDGIIEIRVLNDSEPAVTKKPLGNSYRILNYEVEKGASGQNYIYPIKGK